jgi:hypothetical protein
MTNAGDGHSFPADSLEQAIVHVMKASASEETALSKMIEIEQELLQQAKKLSANLEEFVAVNESVNDIMRNIIKVQMMTQIKLQYLDELLLRIETPEQNERPVE